MSQTPRVPRFYINLMEYFKATKQINVSNTAFNMNPSKKHDAFLTAQTIDIPKMLNDKAYVAYLGHEKGKMSIGHDITGDIAVNANLDTGSITDLSPEYKGFSIASFNGTDSDTLSITTDNDIGSIVIGNYWEAPHSVDMATTLGYSMDGVKNIQTKGGSTLSNASFLGVPDWWNGGAWQMNADNNLRNSRRSWSLSFSMLSEDNVFPKLAASNNLESTYANAGDANPTENTLNDSTDFFTQVWNRTLGSHLEFILQVDKDDFNPDSFAICRFADNSLNVTQTSPLTYQISLKIVESW